MYETKLRWQRKQNKSCKNRVYYHSRESALDDITSTREFIYRCPSCKKFHISIT